MRLNESIVISAPPQLVWDYLAEPSNNLHFMSGITRWEVAGEQRTGLGARYRMLIRVGSAEVGGLIEIVEWDEQRDMAWSSVLGVDQAQYDRYLSAAQALATDAGRRSRSRDTRGRPHPLR